MQTFASSVRKHNADGANGTGGRSAPGQSSHAWFCLRYIGGDFIDLSYNAPAPTAARPPIQASMAKPMTGKKTT